MAGRGGKRPGAGRPKGAISSLKAAQRSARLRHEGRILEHLDQLLTNLFTLADGVKVEEDTPDGKAIVYTTPPDLRANIYLIDRVMGKPTERHEHELELSHLSDDELIRRATALGLTDADMLRLATEIVVGDQADDPPDPLALPR